MNNNFLYLLLKQLEPPPGIAFMNKKSILKTPALVYRGAQFWCKEITGKMLTSIDCDLFLTSVDSVFICAFFTSAYCS